MVFQVRKRIADGVAVGWMSRGSCSASQDSPGVWPCPAYVQWASVSVVASGPSSGSGRPGSGVPGRPGSRRVPAGGHPGWWSSGGTWRRSAPGTEHVRPAPQLAVRVGVSRSKQAWIRRRVWSGTSVSLSSSASSPIRRSTVPVVSAALVAYLATYEATACSVDHRGVVGTDLPHVELCPPAEPGQSGPRRPAPGRSRGRQRPGSHR